MNKFLVTSTLAVLSMSTFANTAQLEAQVSKLSKKVHRLTQMNVDTMTRQELRALKKHLKLSVGILTGNTTPNPGNPRPTPQPPVQRMCANDFADVFQATFKSLKTFAYASDGLDMTSMGATQFAQDFTENNPCSIASEMISNVKRLKKFAYSSAGLDMTSSGAKAYAQDKWSSFCSDYPIESEFKAHYNFAYSSTGMDMTSSGAKKYAIDKVAPQAFSCRAQF